MRNKLLLFIVISVAMATGTSVAMASTLGNGTTNETTSPPPTTVLIITTPDVASAEASVAQHIGNYIAETERQKAEQEAAARKAATTIQKVAPNYDPGDGSRWDQLAQCESGGNWAYPPVAGGFSGGIMFHIGTWKSNGGLEYAPDAYLASREQQIIVAERVLARSGWGAWPGCSRRYGWL